MKRGGIGEEGRDWWRGEGVMEGEGVVGLGCRCRPWAGGRCQCVCSPSIGGGLSLSIGGVMLSVGVCRRQWVSSLCCLSFVGTRGIVRGRWVAICGQWGSFALGARCSWV